MDVDHPNDGADLGGPALIHAPTSVFLRSKLEQKLAMNPSFKFKKPLVTSATVDKRVRKSGNAKETKKIFTHHRSSRDKLESCPIALILRDSRTFRMSPCISETRIYTQCTDETVDSACYQSNALKS